MGANDRATKETRCCVGCGDCARVSAYHLAIVSSLSQPYYSSANGDGAQRTVSNGGGPKLEHLVGRLGQGLEPQRPLQDFLALPLQ